jgi:hypothetical protein
MEPPGRASTHLDEEYEDWDASSREDQLDDEIEPESESEPCSSDNLECNVESSRHIENEAGMRLKSAPTNGGDRHDDHDDGHDGDKKPAARPESAENHHSLEEDRSEFHDARDEMTPPPVVAEANAVFVESKMPPEWMHTSNTSVASSIFQSDGSLLNGHRSNPATATAAGDHPSSPHGSNRSMRTENLDRQDSAATTHTFNNYRHSVASTNRSMNHHPIPSNLHFKDQVRDVIEPVIVEVVEGAADTDAVPFNAAGAQPYPVPPGSPRQASMSVDPPSRSIQASSVQVGPPSMSMHSSSLNVAPTSMPGASQSMLQDTEWHDDKDAVARLVREKFPIGLAQELQKSKLSFPLRLWVVDNSGSMLNSDCSRVVEMEGSGGGKMDVIKCNRWNELQHTVQRQAQLAQILGATTTFRLLNKSRTPGSVDEFTVHNLESEVEHANYVMASTRPDGVTPLTEHIVAIHDRIAAMQDELVANGQRVAVVIATDGIPSDKYGESPDEVRMAFCEALKTLQTLPVWIVLRLCTTEKEVIKFYQKMDKHLERPLECIANYTNEGKEIRTFNSWLNYALPLHRCREMGYHHRVFDLLDERELTIEELREFLELLFGASAMANAPNIHSDWKNFVSFLNTVVQNEERQWCPHTKKLEAWIDLRKLNGVYGGGLLGSIRRKVSDMKMTSS